MNSHMVIGEEVYDFCSETGYVQIVSPSRRLLINLRAHADFVVHETPLGAKIIRKTRAGHSHDFWCTSAAAAESIRQFFVQHMQGIESVDDYTMIVHGIDSKHVVTTKNGEHNSVMTRYSSVGHAKNVWDSYAEDRSL